MEDAKNDVFFVLSNLKIVPRSYFQFAKLASFNLVYLIFPILKIRLSSFTLIQIFLKVKHITLLFGDPNFNFLQNDVSSMVLLSLF